MKNYIESGSKNIMNTYARFPIVLTHGEGMYAFDENGKKYLDFGAGIAVNALGHGNKKLSEAVAAQAAQLIHVSNLYWNKPQVELAEKLVGNSCFDKAFFCNSGAEANEGALKLARKYAAMKENGRFGYVAMNESFHGRTFGAVSCTGQKKYQKGFDPLLPGVSFAEYNNFESFLGVVNKQTCAVLIEPVQGESGIHPSDKEYLRKLREYCSQNDILFIFDEVQCGMGRTGKLFAYEHYGVEPDMVTMAKGLAGGLPIGAILANDKAASAFAPGDHASTFGGNALCTAAANVVVDEVMSLLDNVKEQSEYLTNELMGLKAKNPKITDVRGVGLMLGIELTDAARMYIDKALEKGLLLVSAGQNVIRFVPPLIVTKSEIDECIGILNEVLA